MSATGNATESLLLDVERRLALVDACLLATVPNGLEDACAELRQATVAFAHALQAALAAGARDIALRQHINTIAQRLDEQRTCLARRSVMVERALGSMLRPQPAVTYRMPNQRTVFGG